MLDAPENIAAADGDARGGFVPPYPHRPAQPMPFIRQFILGRRNFLAMFDQTCFEYQFFSARMLNRRVFVCNSPDTVSQAFVALHESFQRKSPQMRMSLAPLVGDGLFVSDGELWAKRRRIVSTIVHGSRLPIFAPVMVEAATELADRWLTLPSPAPIDALREMGTLTAEIICRAVFGVPLGAEAATEIVSAFALYQSIVRNEDVAYLVGLPDWVPRFQPRAVHNAARRIHRVIDDIIARCEERRGSGGTSMMDRLLDARDPETGATLDRTALRNEATVIFMAGHETTANSLAWTWYLLSQAPAVEERLCEEVDAVLGDRPPCLDDVPRLSYTRAVFEEAIRLYPPIALLGREALQEETMRGRKIPKGSVVAIIPWLLHRHRRLWDKPDHFLPERFLPENAGKRERYSYIPFSTGPRVCLGQAFGLTEAILCLATLARRVRLRLAPGTQVEPTCRLSVRPAHGLPMTVEPRR